MFFVRYIISSSVLMVLSAFSAAADIPKVRHIVIVFQENRTPDNLFHGLNKLLPEADIADSGLDSHGLRVVLGSVPLANKYDLSHKHSAFRHMYDGGKMDGADLIACMPHPGTSCPDHPQFKYVDPADVNPYFDIAVKYGFANRMFQSNQGPSFPAHQFIISGTSAPSENSPDFAAENPVNGTAVDGCIAQSQERVALIGPEGREDKMIYPCFEHRTLTDILDARPTLSWRYYTPSAGSLWTAPNAIRHICRPAGAVCTGPDWAGQSKIVLKPSEILSDVRTGNLRTVSWVIPTGAESDHASSNDGSGPSWVASVVNEIGRSSYWENTVILITWDDWGGWYDHVVPPIDRRYGYYENGFRVPLLVVSAYTPARYVSQKNHNFGSILKFIETALGLPVIPPGTYADSRADDLSDFFDFAKPPRKFDPISAPLPADYFLNDTRPVTDPDDD
jgi:phospholipase C